MYTSRGCRDPAVETETPGGDPDSVWTRPRPPG